MIEKKSKQKELILIDPEQKIYKSQGDPIGNGKNGDVYQGYDQLNNRHIALKNVKCNHERSWKKEIDILRLFNHPNIVKYHGCVPQVNKVTNDTMSVYIMTELVVGDNLKDYIKKKKKQKGLSEFQVFKLFKQLLEGYDEIHNKKIVHRDIKPENILVNEEGKIKIIDFGQSQEIRGKQRSGVGTPLYQPPENIEEKTLINPKRDVWSLGLVLYQMIVGERYFQEWVDKNEKQFQKMLIGHKIDIKYPKDFDPFWTNITKRMLDKKPESRIATHELIFEFKKQEYRFQNKFKLNAPTSKKLTESASSGNTDPVTQNQYQAQVKQTRRYLNFFKDKHSLLIHFTNSLKKYCYPFISNAHKYILVFMSLCIYVAAIEDLLKRITKSQIKIKNNEIFDANELEQPYQSEMKNNLSFNRDYFSKQLWLTKYLMLQKIMPKISIQKQRSSTGSQTISSQASIEINKNEIIPYELIDKYPDVKQMINGFQYDNLSKEEYIKRFKNLVFSEQFYIKDENIDRYFYKGDMIIYYMMLLIAHLDQFLDWNNEHYGKQFTKLREVLLRNNRQEQEIPQLLEKIKKYNKKKL